MVNEERHLVSIFNLNKPGVLAEITQVIRNRGFNIEALTISKVDEEAKVHRITVLLYGKPEEIRTLCEELEPLTNIIKIVNLNLVPEGIMEREMALIKIKTMQDNISEIMQIASVNGAETIHSQRGVTIFQISDNEKNISSFVEQINSLCEAEILRSGIVAVSLADEIIVY